MKKLDLLNDCRICPRNCGVDRNLERGYCRSGIEVRISSYNRHPGEEAELSGRLGSGTIFFTGCNLRCVFCQNYDISQFDHGYEVPLEKLAAIMLSLQTEGVHNINLVTPTHYTVQLISALELARQKGLYLPVVWNSNAYEKVETLKKLSGLVDIYLPDLKYADEKAAKKYSDAENYPTISRQAILEMKSQVGDLVTDEQGVARKGLLIRMLVMPGFADETVLSLEWIKDNLGTETHINLMSQYHPSYQAHKYPEINRSIGYEEYNEVKSEAIALGFSNARFQS